MNNILIVDDSPVFRETVRNIITREDYTIAGECSSADETLSWLQNHSADLLILDILMPGSSGMDIIETIKRSHPALKIMVVTALNQKLINDELSSMRVDAILYKPFEPDELIAEIKKILPN
ncbi:MAG: response regulator transcription factor [Elusimicrobiaceae bacterium]